MPDPPHGAAAVGELAPCPEQQPPGITVCPTSKWQKLLRQLSLLDPGWCQRQAPLKIAFQGPGQRGELKDKSCGRDLLLPSDVMALFPVVFAGGRLPKGPEAALPKFLTVMAQDSNVLGSVRPLGLYIFYSI